MLQNVTLCYTPLHLQISIPNHLFHIKNLARMRAFNGDYTVFTTTTGEQGIAAIAVSKDGESYLINEKGERASEN